MFINTARPEKFRNDRFAKLKLTFLFFLFLNTLNDKIICTFWREKIVIHTPIYFPSRGFIETFDFQKGNQYVLAYSYKIDNITNIGGRMTCVVSTKFFNFF